MNSKGILAEKNTNICMKCLKKNAKHTYSIYGRGYGSIYDNFNSEVCLCDDCNKSEYKEWFDETCSYEDENEFYEMYRFEKNIDDLVSSFPLPGQELFYNRFADGAGADYVMDPQDWIDYELDELSHEKCKEYGVISPEERKAYSERYPHCQCVVIKEYSDGSRGSRCEYGAFGDGEGKADLFNTRTECYACPHFVPRDGDIKIVNEMEEYYKNEKERLLYMMEYAPKRLAELEEEMKEYKKLMGNQ